jgi:hypothetical protein
VLREFKRQDTLYHPDAYAKFAGELVSVEAPLVVKIQSAEAQMEYTDSSLNSDVIASDQKLLRLASPGS